MRNGPGRRHAAASAAIRAIVTGPVREVGVLAAFERAVYLEVDPPAAAAGGLTHDLVAVVTADGVALPNALMLNATGRSRALAGCHPRQRGVIGTGGVHLGDLDIDVARWWDPRPALRPVGPDVLADRVDELAVHVEAATGPTPQELALPLRRLVPALVGGDVAEAVHAARSLVGLGPGLTPAGDDVLAGVLAATQLLAPAVRADDALALVTTARTVGDEVARLATDTTTAVSAALLHHAARGQVAAPAGEVLRRLTGPGPMAAAADRLLAVGSTSGRDLAVGLLAAGHAVVAAGAVRSGRMR